MGCIFTIDNTNILDMAESINKGTGASKESQIFNKYIYLTGLDSNKTLSRTYLGYPWSSDISKGKISIDNNTEYISAKGCRPTMFTCTGYTGEYTNTTLTLTKTSSGIKIKEKGDILAPAWIKYMYLIVHAPGGGGGGGKGWYGHGAGGGGGAAVLMYIPLPSSNSDFLVIKMGAPGGGGANSSSGGTGSATNIYLPSDTSNYIITLGGGGGGTGATTSADRPSAGGGGGYGVSWNKIPSGWYIIPFLGCRGGDGRSFGNNQATRPSKSVVSLNQDTVFYGTNQSQIKLFAPGDTFRSECTIGAYMINDNGGYLANGLNVPNGAVEAGTTVNSSHIISGEPWLVAGCGANPVFPRCPSDWITTAMGALPFGLGGAGEKDQGQTGAWGGGGGGGGANNAMFTTGGYGGRGGYGFIAAYY